MKTYLLRPSLATDAGHLTLDGRQMVRQIGNKIRLTEEPTFGRVLTAPSAAAIQTAELFADRTDYVGVIEVLPLLGAATTPASVIAPILLESTADTILVVADEPLLASIGAFLVGRPTFPPSTHAQVAMIDGRAPAWTLRPGELGRQLLLIA